MFLVKRIFHETKIICRALFTNQGFDCCYDFVGPQPDWDPDIVEALDDDFDFDDPDNQLDDDFIVKANDGKAVEVEG